MATAPARPRPARPAHTHAMNDDASDDPGRSCPLHYRYAPRVFASPAAPDLTELDVLYVVGGLYGNELALERTLDLFEQERGRKRLVFNGDFHWFDVDPAVFDRVQRGVSAHTALRGNVETELSAASPADAVDAGCGCAYPAWVGDEVVHRSNRILGRLRGAATDAQRTTLSRLPMWLRADVGGQRLGIVHGDAQSLAGWGFAQEHLRDAQHRAEVRGWVEHAEVHAFVCTHTCLPVFQSLPSTGPRRPALSERWIFNNGAAGMPNFSADPSGLLVRVALSPYQGKQRRFGVRLGEIHVEGIAIDFDASAWREQFVRQWPKGSDAHASYFDRIMQGPAYSLHDVVRRDSDPAC